MRRLIRNVVPLLLLFGVLGAALYLWLRPPSDEATDSGTAETAIDAGVAGSTDRYRIVYEVRTFAGDDATVVSEDVLVRRPFDARVSAGSGSNLSTSISAFGIYAPHGEALYIEPGPPEPDRRPEAALHEAVTEGYAERAEQRRIAGRPCRVYRVGADSGSPSLPPLTKAGDVRVEVCVDGRGLVLEEVRVEAGEVVTRKVAREVESRPRISVGAFSVDPPGHDPRRLGSVQELTDDSRLPGGTFWELPDRDVVGNLRFRGRFAVIPPAQTGFTDITSRGSVITFLSEVWANDRDVVVIDQGATQGARPFERDPNARRVEVGELGEGELRYSLRESEVRVRTSDVRFVRVRGTVAPSRLLEIARSLEGVDGGPLRTAAP